ncbi:MAG: oligosaccharide flippase family protein [Lachnospiraceae bacterium]
MRRIPSESLKNITKISGGTILGQVISIVTLPVITRIYGVEIIGIWTVVTSFANIVTNICDLGLSNSLMMCQDEMIPKWYSIVVKLSNSISIISGIIISLYLLLARSDLTYALTIGGFSALYAFLLRWVNICSIILNRNKEYNILMVNSVLRFSVVAFVSIGLGLLNYRSFGYYIGNVLGQLVTVVHMMRYLPKIELHNRMCEYIEFGQKNVNYIRYQLPASITVTLRTDLPNLLISGLFGNEILGYFSISQKLLTIPITFLGQALGKVFYQKTAEMRRKGQSIGQFVEKSINRGMIIALIPMTLLAAYGDAAVVLYFGTKYAIGGVICRIIVYRSLFNFVSTATQGLDIVLDKQQYVLYTCFSQTIFSVLSVLCGYYVFDSIYITTVLLVISFIVIQIVYFYFMYKCMGLNSVYYVRNAFLIILTMLILSVVLRTVTLHILECLHGGFFEKLLLCFVR